VQAINEILAGTDVGGVARNRRMFLILYPDYLKEEVIEALDAAGVPGFTETDKVVGRGPRGQHFGTQIWPGTDGMIYTVVGEEQVQGVASRLAALSNSVEQRSKGLYGLHVFTWKCDQLL
jgi:Nitrogen regulatory protein P-II